jgi:hypothetical protein
MTQMVHNHFFIMTEIGRMTLPEALSCLHSFITLKNLRTLLRVTLLSYLYIKRFAKNSPINFPFLEIVSFSGALNLFAELFYAFYSKQNYSTEKGSLLDFAFYFLIST